MKKLILLLSAVILFSSCRKEWDNYIDISATGVHIPPCSNAQPQPQPQPQQQPQPIN
jgi:hypothetical protein